MRAIPPHIVPLKDGRGPFGLFEPVHVKTLVAREQRMLLTSRKLVQRKLLGVECDRATLSQRCSASDRPDRGRRHSTPGFTSPVGFEAEAMQTT